MALLGGPSLAGVVACAAGLGVLVGLISALALLRLLLVLFTLALRLVDVVHELVDVLIIDLLVEGAELGGRHRLAAELLPVLLLLVASLLAPALLLGAARVLASARHRVEVMTLIRAILRDAPAHALP